MAFLKRFVEYLKVRSSRMVGDPNADKPSFQTRMRVLHVVAETPPSFLQHLKDITFIERRPLRYIRLVWQAWQPAQSHSSDRFCAERLTSLVRTLELTRLDEYHALQKVAAFATLVATYEKGKRHIRKSICKSDQIASGFLLILEPYETEHATVPNPIFHFTCVSLRCAQLALIPVQLPRPLSGHCASL